MFSSAEHSGTPFGSYRTGSGLMVGQIATKTPRRPPQPPNDPPPVNFGRGASLGSALSSSPANMRQLGSRSYDSTGVSPLYANNEVSSRRPVRGRTLAVDSNVERIYKRPIGTPTPTQHRSRARSDDDPYATGRDSIARTSGGRSLRKEKNGTYLNGEKSTSRCMGCVLM